MSSVTSSAASFSPLERFSVAIKRGEVAFALGLVSILVVLLMPMPTWLLDVALALSLTFSVVVLMTSLFIVTPLEFSAFPTILLVSTMLRLGLNVASTRLILSHGHEGAGAAGSVIKAFGNFVMGGNFVIGIIVFAILVIVNFVVITKGSGRIAEVSARFSLDAMPGKQMAIDADLSGGLISDEEARRRRKNLEEESSFYGSMDGAAKFVRGDAIAGLLITAINIVAGVLIGIVQKDLTFSQALHSYTLLTVGEGLVAQVPALIVSTAAGLLVSKSGSEGSLDKAFFDQLGAYPTALGISSFLLGMMALLPGIPMVPFLALSGMTGASAWKLTERQHHEQQRKQAEIGDKNDSVEVKGEQSIGELMAIDTIRLELGYGLLSLVNGPKNEKFTSQIKALRKQMISDTGFVMPSIRIQDNIQLPPECYQLKMKEILIAEGEVRLNRLMAIGAVEDLDVPGKELTKEPTFGLPAVWIDESMREEVERHGCTVVDAMTVMITHLSEVVKENMSELLSYGDTQKLLTELEGSQQKLVQDLVPTQISVGGLQRVLQALLTERVSIRDLATILEGIGEVAQTKQICTMVEHVRYRLSRQICVSHLNPEGELAFASLSPVWDQRFQEALIGEGDGRQLALQPSYIQEFLQDMRSAMESCWAGQQPAILVTSSMVRPFVRSVTERFFPHVVVLSQGEVHPKLRIRTLGQVG